MSEIQYSFKRYEQKYLLTPEQYSGILEDLRKYMTEDEYGEYAICNIYYDTSSYELIRTSIARSVYKEKFRLRSYGVPDDESTVFAEIKQKYDGIVYKRRVADCVQAIQEFIEEERPLHGDPQIQREIRSFFAMYRPLPKVFIGYDRIALVGKESPELRVTFDRNLRWRDYDLDLCKGDEGMPVLPEERIVMEIKVSGALPLWLAHILSAHKAYPVHFSKYGTCYKRYIAATLWKDRPVAQTAQALPNDKSAERSTL